MISCTTLTYFLSWLGSMYRDRIFLRHTLTKKLLTFLILYLYTFSLYENASLIICSAETEYIGIGITITKYRCKVAYFHAMKKGQVANLH
jgi:hypothetical protein